VTALEELLADLARQSRARFFLRAGRAKGLTCGDGVSGELFGLPMILECEGLLLLQPPKGHGREPGRWRASRNGAEDARASSSPAPLASEAYLAKCKAAIAQAVREMWA